MDAAKRGRPCGANSYRDGVGGGGEVGHCGLLSLVALRHQCEARATVALRFAGTSRKHTSNGQRRARCNVAGLSKGASSARLSLQSQNRARPDTMRVSRRRWARYGGRTPPTARRSARPRRRAPTSAGQSGAICHLAALVAGGPAPCQESMATPSPWRSRLRRSLAERVRGMGSERGGGSRMASVWLASPCWLYSR